MTARPDFTSIASFGEFSEYYWYRAELAATAIRAHTRRGSGRRQRCGRRCGLRAGTRSTHAGSRTKTGSCFRSI